MRRLGLCAILSLAVYLLLFGYIADRPLSLGVLRLELAQKAQRLARLPSPKLVILAGSNGPYSHSCAVIGAMLALPCENAGIAVGIGLDGLFARYAPLLRPGDIVYMPMELQQYVASAAQYRAGADAALLLRHDRALLAGLGPGRIAGALFCCSLGDLLESMAEMPLSGAGVIHPAALLASEYNADGDRIDNDLAAADPALLRQANRPVPDLPAITGGYGSALIARFIRRETSRGIVIIGGLPTDFSSAAVPDATLNAISAIYTGNGGRFLVLPNRSRYPAEDFFNSEDHLARPCQLWHSMLLAGRLGALLHRAVFPAPAGDVAMAGTCPSKQAVLF